MNILDSNNQSEGIQPSYENTDTLSESTKKQIAKLMRDDAAQLTRNDAYYEAMRKTDLNKYRSSKVSEQRFQDAVRLGDKFFSENDE